MRVASTGVDGEIVGDGEQSSFGIIERAPLLEMSEQSKESFLGDVLGPGRVPRFTHHVSEDWNVELFEQSMDSLGERHGCGCHVRREGKCPICKGLARRVAKVEHAGLFHDDPEGGFCV